MRKCCGILAQECVAERRGAYAACGRGQLPRESAAGNEKTKSFQFLHRALCIYELFLLGRDCFFSWILIKYVPNNPTHPYDFGFFCGVIFIIAGVVGFCASIYMVLKGAFSAAYTVDAEGMTTYWRKNTYRLLWTDCIEFEIVQVPINWGTSIAIVYCSTRVLSQKEKENFFWYHKNDFAHVQYFQYSDEAIFQEFLHCVPERARNYLEAKALVLGRRGSEVLFVRYSPADSTNNGCGGTVFAV